MPTRIDKLTDAQKAQMAAHADKWIEIGLRTGKADRARFEAAAEKCYGYAGLPWHGRVVWVSSPLVMALAAPIASLVLQYKKVAVSGAVDGAVRHAVSGAVDGAVRHAVDGAVRDAVSGVFAKQVQEAIAKAWSYYLGGQFWPGGWYWGGAYTSFFREVCGLELQGDLWERCKAYEETILSACWWYPHKDFVMVVERPQAIHRELARAEVTRGWGSHRLHHDSEAAVSWGDGWGVYSVHGVQIPFAKRHIVENPERITVAEIDAETNAEVRRVMLDRFGAERYMREAGAVVVAELPVTHPMVGLRGAKLIRRDLPGDEPIIMVDCVNSSPEPDGSFRRYMLRTDPTAYGGQASTDVLAAMASTWRNADGSLLFKRPQDYAPSFES
jgi:hypothetical protein